VWTLDAITIDCTPDHPVQVYRIAPEGRDAVVSDA
jgi:hypothetical protein